MSDAEQVHKQITKALRKERLRSNESQKKLIEKRMKELGWKGRIHKKRSMIDKLATPLYRSANSMIGNTAAWSAAAGLGHEVLRRNWKWYDKAMGNRNGLQIASSLVTTPVKMAKLKLAGAYETWRAYDKASSATENIKVLPTYSDDASTLTKAIQWGTVPAKAVAKTVVGAGAVIKDWWRRWRR